MTPSQAWQTPALDGEVYAQPLPYGPYIYVATENDSMYKLDAATGAVVWSNHLATPEPSSVAPCGDIMPSIAKSSADRVFWRRDPLGAHGAHNSPNLGATACPGEISTRGALISPRFGASAGSGELCTAPPALA